MVHDGDPRELFTRFAGNPIITAGTFPDVAGSPERREPENAPAERHDPDEGQGPVAERIADDHASRPPSRDEERRKRATCHEREGGNERCSPPTQTIRHLVPSVHAAQQESFDTSRVNVCATSLSPSDIVRYGAHVSARLVTVILCLTA